MYYYLPLVNSNASVYRTSPLSAPLSVLVVSAGALLNSPVRFIAAVTWPTTLDLWESSPFFDSDTVPQRIYVHQCSHLIKLNEVSQAPPNDASLLMDIYTV